MKKWWPISKDWLFEAYWQNSIQDRFIFENRYIYDRLDHTCVYIWLAITCQVWNCNYAMHCYRMTQMVDTISIWESRIVLLLFLQSVALYFARSKQTIMENSHKSKVTTIFSLLLCISIVTLLNISLTKTSQNIPNENTYLRQAKGKYLISHAFHDNWFEWSCSLHEHLYRTSLIKKHFRFVQGPKFLPKHNKRERQHSWWYDIEVDSNRIELILNWFLSNFLNIFSSFE